MDSPPILQGRQLLWLPIFFYVSHSRLKSGLFKKIRICSHGEQILSFWIDHFSEGKNNFNRAARTLCSFMVNSTRRFIYCLDLRFILVFFGPFSIAITSLGEERAGLCAFRAFVRFARDGLYPFPVALPLGVRDWLWLGIVALPLLKKSHST